MGLLLRFAGTVDCLLNLVAVDLHFGRSGESESGLVPTQLDNRDLDAFVADGDNDFFPFFAAQN